MISYFSSTKFSNKLLCINVILFSTWLFLAFVFAISMALWLISVAVISQFSIYFANDTAIAPLPVHKSKNFACNSGTNFAFSLYILGFDANFITSSTKIEI